MEEQSVAASSSATLTAWAADHNLISRKDWAAKLGRRYETLIRWEEDGVGPAPVRIGRTVFYSKDSIEAWLKAGGATK